jgi:hypothetical protein
MTVDEARAIERERAKLTQVEKDICAILTQIQGILKSYSRILNINTKLLIRIAQAGGIGVQGIMQEVENDMKEEVK